MQFAQAYPAQNMSNKPAAKKLYNDFILHFGFPTTVQYDQGADLTTKFLIESKSFVVLQIYLKHHAICREMDKLIASIDLCFPCFTLFLNHEKAVGKVWNA